MNRSIIRTTHAPAAIGPYSQAVVVPLGDGQRMVFCSGQIALDPVSGQIVEGDVAVQTRQVLENLGAVLAAADARFADIVKTTIFLADMADFAAVNEVYGRVLGEARPARSTVAVAGLPRGVRVEIEAVAVVSAGTR